MKLRHFNETFIRVNQTHSTNSLMWKNAEIESYTNGFSIVAQAQTKGKGQKGNVWMTEPGKNLTFSVLVFPQLEPKNVFYLNMMAALAIEKTLDEFKIDAKIKWPNDILVNDHKIAGLLIENQIQGQKINKTVVGIGLNVNQNHFPLARPVTSVSLETGKVEDLDDVLKILYQNLDFFFNILLNKDFDLLKKLYLKKLYRYKEWANYRSEKTGQFIGQITGIDENGKIIIQFLDHSKAHFDMQTIQFI